MVRGVEANDSLHGLTNGTNPVTVVPAPAADRYRAVHAVLVHNSTGASITATLRLNDGGTTRILYNIAITTNSTANFINEALTPLIILAPNQSLEVLLAAAGAVPWYSAWGEPRLP